MAAKRGLPGLVIAADWSIAPGKRWMARAELKSGRYVASAPERVPPSPDFLQDLRREVAVCRRVVLVGLDFPIGLPRAYAACAGIDSFLDLLSLLRRRDAKWKLFLDVAANKNEISLFRPFYPYRPGGTRMSHLERVIGPKDKWLRRCERATNGRRTASPLFWTMGAKQVGKAAISGWKELLIPCLEDRSTKIWPFGGDIAKLARCPRLILAEVYPAESYAHVGVSFPGGKDGGKRSQTARKRQAKAILDFATRNGIKLRHMLEQQVCQGFGKEEDGEDPFDATAALLSMIGSSSTPFCVPGL